MSTESPLGRAGHPATHYVLAVAVLATVLILVSYPDDRTRELFRTSILLAATTTIIAVPIGVSLAWLTARTDVVGRRWMLYSLLVGVLLPLYLHAAVWEAGFGRLGWLHLRDDMNLPLLSGWRAAVWIHVLASIPWVVLFVFAHQNLFTSELEETALLDATPLQVFRRVTIVQLIPVFIFSALWVMVWVAGEMTVTDLFQVRTFAEEIYIGFAIDRIGGESAVTPSVSAGIAFLAILILLALSACLLVAPRLRTVTTHRRAFVFRLGWWRWPLTILVLGAVALTVVLPMANLIIKAGTQVRPHGRTMDHAWSATKVLRMALASWWEFRGEIGWSLAICQLASLTACAVSIVLYAAAQHSRTVIIFSLLLAATCLALPGPLLGIATIRVFSYFQSPYMEFVYSHTIAAPWIAMTIKVLPLVMALIWIAMRMSPGELADAARNAGANTWQSLLYVLIPARQTALLMAFLAGVVFCLGDLAASILVVPPGVTTLAISIFGMIHSGVEDRLAALCLASTGTLLILGVLIGWTFRTALYGQRA